MGTYFELQATPLTLHFTRSQRHYTLHWKRSVDYSKKPGIRAPIKVRMGIHTGAAQASAHMELGDGYDGYLTLTRTQRVMSVAHGGQVLLSGASAELVRGYLPEDGTLRDMGEHRLKGLVNPERLWQLVVPDLLSEFPPLLSYNAIPNNLPAQPTALIGREVYIARVLKKNHLLTGNAPGVYNMQL